MKASLRFKQKPFLFWIAAVQLLAVLPLLCFAVWAVRQAGERIQAEAVADLQQRAAIAANAIAREAERVKTKVEILSSQEAAQSGDIAAMRRAAVVMMSTDASIAGASALDRSGQLLFTTHRPAGERLPKVPMPAGAAHVFEKEQTFVSGLALGGLNDVALVGFATPWRVNGDVRYALRMALKPAALGELLRDQRWPGSWTAALVDQNMVIVARSRSEAEFFGKPATESLQRLIKSGTTAVTYARTKDGVEVATAIAPVRGTPWFVAAGLPVAELTEQAAGPFRQVVVGGILLTALGLFASLALSRNLNRQIRDAANGAGAGAGSIGVQELATVAAQKLMLQNDLVGMVRLVNRQSTWHNPALERIFGYEPGELTGHSPRQMHVDDAAFESFGQRAYASISAGERFRDQLQMVRKDGSKIWADVSGVAMPDGGTLWMILDITAMRQVQEELAGLAFRDQLTQLPNRALLEDRLQQCIAAAERNDEPFAVCLLDLNGFKAVNDQLGHGVGDDLLRGIAARLQAVIRANDTAARLGGDEFVLVLTQLQNTEEAGDIVSRVRDAVRQDVAVGQVVCSVSAAMGLAFYPQDGTDVRALLAAADERMYADKAASKTKRPT